MKKGSQISGEDLSYSCHTEEYPAEKLLGNDHTIPCSGRQELCFVGLMVRTDHLGVTSFIWELGMRPDLSETMLHFSRAASWELARVRQTWYEIVKAKAPICREGAWNILIGDGVKQSKETRCTPGEKKLFQESSEIRAEDPASR